MKINPTTNIVLITLCVLLSATSGITTVEWGFNTYKMMTSGYKQCGDLIFKNYAEKPRHVAYRPTFYDPEEVPGFLAVKLGVEVLKELPAKTGMRLEMAYGTLGKVPYYNNKGKLRYKDGTVWKNIPCFLDLYGSCIFEDICSSKVWDCPVQKSDEWGTLKIPLPSSVVMYFLRDELKDAGTLRVIARHLDLPETEEPSSSFRNETISCFDIEIAIVKVKN